MTDLLDRSPGVSTGAPGTQRKPGDAAATGETHTTHDFLRGSSFLLSGRFIAITLNLCVQVLTVRYLSKGDYGAFAYALAVASMGSSLVLLGLDKSIARFVPIYQERGEVRKAFGAIVLGVFLVAALGLSAVFLTVGMQGLIMGTVVTDPLSLSLLLILIALAPVDALDNLLQGVMAIFVGARAIFFRRHVLGPGLKLAAVLLVILTAGDVYMLAWGYVTGGLLGVSTYVAMLLRAWQKQGLLHHLRLRATQFPAREVLSYSVPLLSSEVILILRSSLAIIALEYLQTTEAVAEYRSVFPLARLNIIALQSFTLLFIPLASRIYSRGEREAMHELYWRTTLWITVLSFPIFATTFALAEPVTILFFGAKYVESASVLAVLAVGYYFHAVFGFNGLTLRVYGKLRYILTIDTIVALVGAASLLLLIPRYGALGAALSTAGTFVLHHVLNHLGLLFGDTGVRLFETRHLGVYGLITGLAIGLLLFQSMFAPPLYVGLGLVVLSSVLLIRVTRTLVRPEEVFPKLLRVPGLRRLLT